MTAPDSRSKRETHLLDGDGMLVCNPRDPEAAHRAQVEGIATENPNAVTCRKCLERSLRQTQGLIRSSRTIPR